jgi:tetratricopeptide (TPR) repeat protein
MRSIVMSLLVVGHTGFTGPPAAEPAVPTARQRPALPPADEPAPDVEAVSLLGDPLPAPRIDDGFRARQEELLAAALGRLDEAPGEPESWIWVGRRTAYLGRYREAIEIYGQALERFPDEPRLYRHRGHRFITTRRLERAVEDLSRAAELVRGRPDETEPDGLPNEMGIPTSTLQSNIWYHLGLAHYLAGDFERALAAYRECLAVSRSPDMLVATSYWLYLTLGRSGRAEEAAGVLEPITPELEVIENHDYHRLLLSYRRLADAHAMWDEAVRDPTSVGYATVGYGLGAYHLIGGRPEKARGWFERVLESPAWAAFGYLAAEAELARAP